MKKYNPGIMVLVTHVPKCVGTSLRAALLEGLSIPDSQVYKPSGKGGLKLMRKEHPDEFAYMIGHRPWGVHALFRMQSRAFWMDKIHIATLRDPIDQMISYYYYHQQILSQSPMRHYMRKDQTIVDFYREVPKVTNMQTRMFAGIPFSYLASKNRLIGKILTKMALQHLMNNYHYWVHHSHLQASMKILSEGLGAHLELPHVALTTVKERPKLMDLSDEDRLELEKINHLDVRLHELLKPHIARRFVDVP